MYELTDRTIQRINERISRKFAVIRRKLTSFDEINILRYAREAYRELYAEFEEMLLVLAEDTYSRMNGGNKNRINLEWIRSELDSIDPAAKYRFSSEIERMAERLAEMVESTDTPTKKDFDTEMKKLSLVVGQEAIFITDEALKQAYKDSKVKKVRWMTVHDEKRCGYCWSLNGRIFPIDEVPDKPHRNCRCWIVAVKEKE